MKILITGGAGFIGAHLTSALAGRGHAVTVIDRRNNPGDDLLHPGRFAAALRDADPDIVVHLAAQVGRLFGEDDIRNSVRSNTEMTAVVASECGRKGVRVAYASTSEVYGDRGQRLCREDDPLDVLPHNAYGLTKRQGEEFCRLYTQDPLIMRFSMPYGTGVKPGRGRAALPNILWQAHTGQPIPIHRGAERSWCWVEDTIHAVVTLLETRLSGAWNIGRDDDPRLLRDLALLACEMTGASPDLIKDVDPPVAQTVVKRLSTEKMMALGWKPTVDVEEGMARVLEWVSRFDRDGRVIPSRAAA